MRAATASLRRNDDGNLTTEFALTVPLFLSLFLGVLELGNFYILAGSLENAVLRASRFGITGSDGSATPRADQVRAIILEETAGRIPEEDLEITTQVFEQFADIGETEPFVDSNGSGTWEAGEAFTDVNGNGNWDDDLSVAGLGGPGDIVLYQVRYNAPSLSGLFDWATTIFPVTATVAVRNEPF